LGSSKALERARFSGIKWVLLALIDPSPNSPFFFLVEPRYIGGMLWRRGRPLNAPAAFIHPCQPIVAKQPPTGPGGAHEPP
jgi:hypothetical protein